MRELERVCPNLAGQSSRYGQAWPLARLPRVSLVSLWVPLSSHRFHLAHHRPGHHVGTWGLTGELKLDSDSRRESLRQAGVSERSQCPIPQPKVSPDLGLPSAITQSRSREERGPFPKHCWVSLPLRMSSGLEHSVVHLDLSLRQLSPPWGGLPYLRPPPFLASGGVHPPVPSPRELRPPSRSSTCPSVARSL